MIQLSPEQQKAIEEQKEQCPFCKIIRGEIPAKSVYEDEKTLIILDINPATPGHMLVMPKEHYPIMPLIPPAMVDHLSLIIKGAMESAYDGVLCKGITMLVANGGAAGQQSSHFMVHIIPREEDDNAAVLDIPQKPIPSADIQAPYPKLKAGLTRMMASHLEGKEAVPAKAAGPQEITEDRIVAIVEANPPLLKAVLETPGEFKRLVGEHPQLHVLFKGKDLDSVVQKIKAKHGKAGGNAADGETDSGNQAPSDGQQKKEDGTDLDAISNLFK
ncbi:HIT domain-containing protein [Candidatus Woesearchaeota archaeon]|nr:HIT domain-containing protein [Candidatus Woesearchaeota archaeon]